MKGRIEETSEEETPDSMDGGYRGTIDAKVEEEIEETPDSMDGGYRGTIGTKIEEETQETPDSMPTMEPPSVLVPLHSSELDAEKNGLRHIQRERFVLERRLQQEQAKLKKQRAGG